MFHNSETGMQSEIEKSCDCSSSERQNNFYRKFPFYLSSNSFANSTENSFEFVFKSS